MILTQKQLQQTEIHIKGDGDKAEYVRWAADENARLDIYQNLDENLERYAQAKRFRGRKQRAILKKWQQHQKGDALTSKARAEAVSEFLEGVDGIGKTRQDSLLKVLAQKVAFELSRVTAQSEIANSEEFQQLLSNQQKLPGLEAKVTAAQKRERQAKARAAQLRSELVAARDEHVAAIAKQRAEAEQVLEQAIQGRVQAEQALGIAQQEHAQALEAHDLQVAAIQRKLDSTESRAQAAEQKRDASDEQSALSRAQTEQAARMFEHLHQRLEEKDEQIQTLKQENRTLKAIGDFWKRIAKRFIGLKKWFWKRRGPLARQRPAQTVGQAITAAEQAAHHQGKALPELHGLPDDLHAEQKAILNSPIVEPDGDILREGVSASVLVSGTASLLANKTIEQSDAAAVSGAAKPSGPAELQATGFPDDMVEVPLTDSEAPAVMLGSDGGA